MQTTETIDPTGQIDTVESLADAVNAFNQGGIRWTIFQHKQDLIEYGAIFYNGKKLLIDREKFIEYFVELPIVGVSDFLN